MKAVIYEQYGSPEVLKVKELEKPIPKDDEVLVKVFASSVGFGDLMARNFKNTPADKFYMPFFLKIFSKIYFGWSKPRIKILGSQYSGVVEGVGKDVKKFKVGDEVFAYPAEKMGGYAEYTTMKEDGMIALKPENMSFEEASCVLSGSLTALKNLEKVKIKKGDKVLINGASGSIGSHALQLLKYYGAEVTAVCGTPRLEYVKALGADYVLDYTKEDFTKNGKKYELIYDILGKSSFSKCKNSLSRNGVYLLASFKTKKLLQMIWTKITRSNKKVICTLARCKPDDITKIKELIEKGALKEIIDRKFTMEQASEAHRYAESGEKKGSVVITLV